ncbi:MAG: heavy-metal-associated domain-containing protein [Fluviicola sp.]
MFLKSLVALVALTALSFSSGDGKKERATFTIYGECGMCETRIENAINEMEGVIWADWEEATLELTVKYDTSKTSLDKIKQKAAAIGHDTNEIRASEEAYENLHPCCKYERPKSKSSDSGKK